MTTKTATNLQDNLLNQMRKDNIQTTVYLINGFQLKGTVRSFDNFTVVLDSEGKQMLIYKHAISTITPSRPVNTSLGEDKSRNPDANET